MSVDWPTIPLGSLVTVKGGKRLPKEDNLQVEPTPHPYIRVRDMGQRFLPDAGLEYVPIDVFPKIKRYIVEENDVLISIVGTIGLVSIVDKRFHLASQTENSAKLIGLDRIDGLCLYYYLISSTGQNHIKQATVGAVQAKLPLYNIEKIPVVWPARTEREKIVEYLCPVDDKIELNRQINQNLEQIAQAIFKSWFVDFEPIKAKIEAKAAGRDPARAAMCAISGKSESELDQLPPEHYQQLAATAALFPDELVESELGLIPEGWEVGTVDEEFDLTMGQSPPGNTYNESKEGLPFYQGRTDFGFRHCCLIV